MAKQKSVQNTVAKRQIKPIKRKDDKSDSAFARRLDKMFYGFSGGGSVDVGHSVSELFAYMLTSKFAIARFNEIQSVSEGPTDANNELAHEYPSMNADDIVPSIAHAFARFADCGTDNTIEDVSNLLGREETDAIVREATADVMTAWKALGSLVACAVPSDTSKVRESNSGILVGRGPISTIQRFIFGYDSKQCANINVTCISIVVSLARKKTKRTSSDTTRIDEACAVMSSFLKYLDEADSASQLMYEYASDNQLAELENKCYENWNLLGEWIFSIM